MERKTAMNGKQLILGIALLASVGAATMAAQNSSAGAPAPAPKAAPRHSGGKQSGKENEQDEGQRIFERRCSNCHNAPEGFSPRISGTVVRHMRVRANLSQHEEEALQRFFNP
jgi:cytochrome c5